MHISLLNWCKSDKLNSLTNAQTKIKQQTQLFRDANAGGDTFTADARVLGVKIFFTTDAANDL